MSTILNNKWDIIYIQTLPAQEVYVNYWTSLLSRNGSKKLRRDSNTGVFLWIFRKFWKHFFSQNASGQLLLSFSTWHRKTPVPESVFNKAAGLSLQLNLKKDPGTGASCEFREISKNTFSYRRPPVAASAFFVLGVNKKNNLFSNNSLITCKFLEYSTILFANDTLKEKLDLIRLRGSRPEVF